MTSKKIEGQMENGNLNFLPNCSSEKYSLEFSSPNEIKSKLNSSNCCEDAAASAMTFGTSSFLDGDGESDHESHTSSLESGPSDHLGPNEKYGSRDGYCSEEELGSSTSCSVDSFEITSPFGTMDSFRRKTDGKSIEQEYFEAEETPKVENKGDYSRFTLPDSGFDNNGGSNIGSLSTVSQCKEYAGLGNSSSEGAELLPENVNPQENCTENSRVHTVSSPCSSTSCTELDTGLPNLDFEKLEEQLNCAAREREMDQRKLMFEEVRKKLAMDTDDSLAYPPIPATRPARSNLAKRLQSGKNLQVCFMNDGVVSEDDEEDSSESCSNNEAEGVSGFFPKSKSTPNLSGKKRPESSVSRSVSSVGDSTKKASELRRAASEREAEATRNPESRQAKLEEETRLMLAKAKQAARMQMEVERQSKSSKSFIEDIVGIPLSRRRLTRPQLMRLGITQLQLIVNDLLTKIESLNEELVELLVDRDNLHMEQDSMLVDVEDLVQ